jgi:CrcB protein
MTVLSLIPNDAVAIGIGACFGAMSRYQVGQVAAEYVAKNKRLEPWTGFHTAGINVAGSFLLGGVTGSPVVSARPSPAKMGLPSYGLTPRTKLMLGVGFCGSFTTFSTFSVDVATWLAQGQTTKAVSYVLVNNVGGIVAAATGLVLVKKLFG